MVGNQHLIAYYQGQKIPIENSALVSGHSTCEWQALRGPGSLLRGKMRGSHNRGQGRGMCSGSVSSFVLSRLGCLSGFLALLLEAKKILTGIFASKMKPLLVRQSLFVAERRGIRLERRSVRGHADSLSPRVWRR